MPSAEELEQYRPLLFSVAYRMLGSVTEAEDAVQEAFLRRHTVGDLEIQSEKAFLVTTVTRLCIDQLRSARVRRERYVGPWLPEPLVGERRLEETVGETETLSMAFLVLLESLNPTERAVFLLREVFDYDYDEVARIVGKSEANCRQIARRAREHVHARRPRFEPSHQRRQELTVRFASACRNGDLPGLIALLDRDITFWSDGGGKATAALNPVYGSDKVARFILGVRRKFPRPAVTLPVRVNGQPGFVTWEKGRPVTVLALEIYDGRITGICAVRNPDKLRTIEPLPLTADGQKENPVVLTGS